MNYCVRERRIFLNGEIKNWPGWGKRKNKIESQVRRGPEQEVWFLRPSGAAQRKNKAKYSKAKIGVNVVSSRYRHAQCHTFLSSGEYCINLS